MLVLSVLLVSIFFSCDDFNRSTKHPINYGHDYEGHEGHDHSDHEAIVQPAIDISSTEDVYSDAERAAWQRPELIRTYFRETKGKVLADIGAGPKGFFTLDFVYNTDLKKILALDIDASVLDTINVYKKELEPRIADRIETRLVAEDNPKILENEVDIVFIANTLTYIEDRLDYVSNLKNALKPNGLLVIVDWKKKRIKGDEDDIPSREERIALYEMEDLVIDAGFERLVSDDWSLPYQYIVVGKNK